MTGVSGSSRYLSRSRPGWNARARRENQATDVPVLTKPSLMLWTGMRKAFSDPAFSKSFRTPLRSPPEKLTAAVFSGLAFRQRRAAKTMSLLWPPLLRSRILAVERAASLKEFSE